ncbi:MAG: hypothetical protein HYR73_03360 [Candidatus Eisenbacteria bacterium]|nr:hypothetical protein [Candidatus Eisenbacteria bacterium]
MSGGGTAVSRDAGAARPGTATSGGGAAGSRAPGSIPAGAARTARALTLGALLIYAAVGGGRVVGSDEVTMLEVARSMLHGSVDVPEGATLRGSDGRFHSKNAAGQAVLALPLVAASEAVSRALPLDPAKSALAERAMISFFNALVTAFLLGVFYGSARALGVGSGSALATAMLLAFTTPLAVYAKSFMAEPLEALGLLLALTGAARARAGDGRAARTAALGAVIAISSKLSVLPLALACLSPLAGAPRSSWRWPLIAIAIALAGHAAYDFARFGTPFETGYGAQASPTAFPTPLWVGLYGLLLSSGKGVLWFAPTLWLAPAGLAAMTRGPGSASSDAAAADTRDVAAPDARSAPAAVAARRSAARAILFAWGFALVVFGRFQHWAGDGSFGPRYLVPLLPLAFIAVAFALDRASRVRRVVGSLLAVAGLLVTLGGVAIYFGAEMREAGDYPYSRSLDDPHFMESSHFNPRFTPILSHWSMLGRNVALHLKGDAPRLTGVGERDARLGISDADQRQMLHALDFWWTYAAYAGLPFAPLAAAALALLIGGLLALRGAARARRVEAG